MAKKAEQSAQRKLWAARLAKAGQDYSIFHTSGKKVVDTYRIEQRSNAQQDKYNILYSITETIKPSMYSQTPKPEVKRRHVDRNNPVVLASTLLMESALSYTLDEQDFDEVIGSCVEDFLLPGMGVLWVRYEPTIKREPMYDPASEEKVPLVDDKGEPQYVETVEYEKVLFDYINWQDFRTGRGRRWSELPWIAKRVYLDKQQVTRLTGDPVIANKLQYSAAGEGTNQDQSIAADTAEVWEIWDKRKREVVWYAETYPDDVLKVEPDFLNLKDFWPCPRPLRAVTTNNKFIPRPFFSQYQAQADELNDITGRIRKLARALKAVGVYDQSVPALQNLLSGGDNKMIPVDNWATMAEKGGIKGTVDFLPITDVATVLLQLYDAREKIKAEIYEITGWSDIIRGVSKASETLGAQQLKAEWAGSRLKLLQKEVQRFVRDAFRIAGEIISEQFGETQLLLMAGFDPEERNDPEFAKYYQTFQMVHKMIRDEKERCALIGVETDSTLLPDEANDKKERMEFIGAVGAFLQQAIPASQQTPQLGPVLGEILMFAVRGFRGARTMENTFQQFVTNMQQMGGQQQGKPGEQQKGDNGQSAALSAQAKMQDTASKEKLGMAELQQDAAQANSELELERVKETNRHNEKMAELALREREVRVKEAELGLEQTQQQLDQRNVEDDRFENRVARSEDRLDKAADRDAQAQKQAGGGNGAESA